MQSNKVRDSLYFFPSQTIVWSWVILKVRLANLQNIFEVPFDSEVEHKMSNTDTWKLCRKYVKSVV